MNAFGFYNSLYPGADLTEEQKRYILGRSLLSGGMGIASRWGQPVGRGPSPIQAGITAALQDYDTFAQMALQAQIVKQQKEYKEQQDAQREERAQRAMEIQESQEKRAEEYHKKRMEQLDLAMKLARTKPTEAKKENKAWDIWTTQLQPFLAGKASQEDMLAAEAGAKMGNLTYGVELVKGGGKITGALGGMIDIPGVGKVPMSQLMGQQEQQPTPAQPPDLGEAMKIEEVKQQEQRDYVQARKLVDDVTTAYVSTPWGFSRMDKAQLEALYKKLEEAYPMMVDAPWWQGMGYQTKIESMGAKIRQRLRELQEEK